MSSTRKTIGIAVVELRGSYLVGTRGPGSVLAGFDEFPGGKCLPSEAPEVCACRECLEETGLEVVPIRLLLNCLHEYPHGAVDLHFWLCAPRASAEIAADLRGYRWVPKSELSALHFPDANDPLVKLLNSPA